MPSGIYQIIHIETGRRYVGQASNITKRWTAHRLRLKVGNHHAPHLQAAWTKYGPDAFSFEIIEICEIDALDRTEQRYLDEWQPDFNTAKFARTRRGVPHSPESKAKLSASGRARGWSPSKEHREALRQANLGKKASKEAKAKMRAAKIGRKHSEESRKNMVEAQRRRGPTRPSSEYDSRRGRKADPIAVEKSAAARRGSKRTPEQLERIRQAASRMTPENRRKIAQARRDAFAARRWATRRQFRIVRAQPIILSRVLPSPFETMWSTDNG